MNTLKEDEMDLTAVRLGRRSAVALTAAVALGLAAGCSSSSGGASSTAGGMPATVNVVSINPQTGPAAFAGLAANKGYELAIKEINDTKFLGGTTLTLSKVDTKGDIKTAASAASTAIADKSISAIFGSVSSQEAVAMSPLVQQAGVPTIYTQAGSDGVIVGDATYRATPLMRNYYGNVKKFIKDKGWKSIGIIHTAAAPTLVDIGTKALPAIAQELGMTVTTTVATQGTTQDFTAPISQVLASKPDAVAILLVGPANPTAMKQLRQAGYTGDVLGNSGASAGNLKPAGADGAGMVWPTDFNYQQKAPSSQKFVTLYQASNPGENPLNYAAEAYDAAWFLAKSIKAAGNADRAAIKTAMGTVSGQSFDGALGTGLTWKDREIVVPGVMIRYDGTNEVLLYEGSGS